MGSNIECLKVIFVYLLYLSTIIHLFDSKKKTIQTLLAEEMYHGLIFPHAKQCKVIHYELMTTYFIAWAKLLTQIWE